MPLTYHPETGTILICDYNLGGGFIEPEMVKRRPVVVISPRFRHRDWLCTVVPLSTTPPSPAQAYHYKLELDDPLPEPYNSPVQWVKGDMLATVSFKRLSFPFRGKDESGRRQNIINIVDPADLRNIRECVLYALALSHLTEHL